ncbi:MAG: MBOAT family protein [Lachnospiraceae bacterium]|nr:MBOAT family protein [Lachnospiraceae bacterium]
MVFSSLEFIFVFLPVFLSLYYLMPAKCKNWILLFGSLAFYAAGSLQCPWYSLLLVACVLVDFMGGVLMERFPKAAKPVFFLCVIFHIFWLFSFKYAGLFPYNRSWILPAGISFYTFQGISYLADVLSKKYKAEYSLLKFATYICMFPQLIAGPIVTYDAVSKDLEQRKHTVTLFWKGMESFVFGIGLKVLLANPCGTMWERICAIGFDSLSTPLAWLGIIAFTFQIYFDFFGYSLMAYGLGRMLGFKLPRNFEHPYTATSMTEFWRKWHITLGAWFREYVYIPLGGNKKGFLRMIFNLLVVWIFTGIWHGSTINFLLWGLVLFSLIVLEKLFWRKVTERVKWLGHLYMWLMIPLSWVFFAITDLEQIGIFFSKLFAFDGFNAIAQATDYYKYLWDYWYILAAGLFFSFRFPYQWLKKWPVPLKAIGLTLVLAGSAYCMYRGMNNPFLYFRF